MQSKSGSMCVPAALVVRKMAIIVDLLVAQAESRLINLESAGSNLLILIFIAGFERVDRG